MDPGHALDVAALRYSIRARKEATRLREVFEKWGWQRVEALRYTTPDGEVSWLEDGAATISQAAERAFYRAALAQEGGRSRVAMARRLVQWRAQPAVSRVGVGARVQQREQAALLPARGRVLQRRVFPQALGLLARVCLSDRLAVCG